ncbi:hypothetical protein HanXRQr2_Chr17g0782971 [Helianthus annuus]|uniref:Uncharacterized protein n=1 Tax=Helianthus annuus TaxID=4232 RepID=A0A251ULD1_HELAN|nr:uncharacterized protein LOC110865508 [Helianthus annuus]KAF5753693.1 hypothetical protein HanXRQr2_Chr17g0782971 [Helianthus annuus]
MRSLQFCCFLLIIGCLVSQIYASSDAAAAILYDKFFFEGSWIVSEKKGDHHSGSRVDIKETKQLTRQNNLRKTAYCCEVDWGTFECWELEFLCQKRCEEVDETCRVV